MATRARALMPAPASARGDTAINEEVLVNGYFHLYYGVGLIATIPYGYVVTRSFQKRGRLLRPVVAHFLFDAILITIAVLTS